MLSSDVPSSSTAPAPAGHGSFVPRPFPPPALENVPLPYILDQLHNLAVHYWDKPETADCTIVVPIVQSRPARNSTGCIIPEAADVPVSAPAALLTHPHQAPAAMARRGTEPATPVSRVTRMTSKLHLDYLLSQSSLFRDLFSGKPIPGPLDRSRPESPNTPPLLPRIQPPAHRQPRLLAGSTPSHPIVHLPLPDPSSFPHLVHYMYFGTPAALEAALDAGAVQWAGVVRNAEYLGMRAPLKAFLGRWYARHAGAHAAAGACRPPIVFGEEDEEEGWDVDMVDDEEDGDDSSSYSGGSRSGSEYDSASESEYDSAEDDDDEDEDDRMSDTDDTLESVGGAETDVAETAEDAKARIVKKVTSWMDDGAEPERGRSVARKTSMAPEVSPLRRPMYRY